MELTSNQLDLPNLTLSHFILGCCSLLRQFLLLSPVSFFTLGYLCDCPSIIVRNCFDEIPRGCFVSRQTEINLGMRLGEDGSEVNMSCPRWLAH